MLLLELLKVANFAGQQNMELLNRLQQIGQPINAPQLTQTTGRQASSMSTASQHQLQPLIEAATEMLDSFRPLDLSMNRTTKHQDAIHSRQPSGPQRQQVARQRFTRSNRPPPIALNLVTKREKSNQEHANDHQQTTTTTTTTTKLTNISSSTSPSSAHSNATPSTPSTCPSLRSPTSDTISSTNGCRTGRSGKQKRAKSHLCNECGRSFSRSDMLTRHWRLHSGLKPYQCGECLQVFSRSDHLATHERTHTGEKPYQCEFCEYSACRRDMITRHMRTHTGKGTKSKRIKTLKKIKMRKVDDEKDGVELSSGLDDRIIKREDETDVELL